MLRLTCMLAASSAALLFALSASAEPSRALTGTVSSITSTQLTVRGEHASLRCALRAKSPSVAGLVAGARVQIACVRDGDGFVLAKLHLLTEQASSESAPPVSFGGAVTAVSATSISLHDGDRNLTCSIGQGSPSTQGVKVGEHARVACANGLLTAFALVVVPSAPPTTTAPTTTTTPTTSTPAPQPALLALGVISALSSSAVTVHNNEHGDLTCTLTDGSPRLGDYHVGDPVRLGCTADHVVVSIARP